MRGRSKPLSRKGRPAKVETLGGYYSVVVKGRTYKFLTDSRTDALRRLPIPPGGNTEDREYAYEVVQKWSER